MDALILLPLIAFRDQYKGNRKSRFATSEHDYATLPKDVANTRGRRGATSWLTASNDKLLLLGVTITRPQAVNNKWGHPFLLFKRTKGQILYTIKHMKNLGVLGNHKVNLSNSLKEEDGMRPDIHFCALILPLCVSSLANTNYYY